MKYILRMQSAENSDQVFLSDRALSHIGVSNKATEVWKQDMFAVPNDVRVHNDTLWLYLGTVVGTAIVAPGNFWGTSYDATRRPWFMRAVALLERRPVRPVAVVSTPYVDGGGAGLVVTLSAVVWDKDTKPLDLERKHQIFGVAGYDFPLSNVYWAKMSGGVCSHINIFCTLIDSFGSLVFHPAFASSNVVNGKIDGHPVSDMFLGVQEPDLADALIKHNLLVFKKCYKK